MELIHARFVDADGKTLAAEELTPSKGVKPEMRITTGQRTSVTLDVDDVRSLRDVCERFLDKHSGPEGGAE